MAQPHTDSVLQNILKQNKNLLLQKVIADKDSFRLQIIYTQINRDKYNSPSFTNYNFNVDSNLYFNPASIVKLPLSLLALEKLNALKIKGVDKNTSLQIDSNFYWQMPAYKDSTAATGLPSIAHYIKKAFLISDNDAYNRLYQFAGQQNINSNLHNKGFTATLITRQFLGLSVLQNRHSNAFRFLDIDKKQLYYKPPAYNTDSFYFGKPVKIGRGHYNSKDSLVNEPIDFTAANKLTLQNFQQMLQTLLFPQSVSPRQRFNLSSDDYTFLYRYLSQYPSETDYPKYDTAKFYDSYVKFYFKNAAHKISPYIRVFNKVGWAYGFLIDGSYVVDFKNKVEFMLTAVLYVNSDGILNDDKYDYESIGWPFMYELGQTIYRYELQRPKKIKPNLKDFKILYEQRNPDDTRPAIKDADN